MVISHGRKKKLLTLNQQNKSILLLSLSSKVQLKNIEQLEILSRGKCLPAELRINMTTNRQHFKKKLTTYFLFMGIQGIQGFYSKWNATPPDLKSTTKNLPLTCFFDEKIFNEDWNSLTINQLFCAPKNWHQNHQTPNCQSDRKTLFQKIVWWNSSKMLRSPRRLSGDHQSPLPIPDNDRHHWWGG